MNKLIEQFDGSDRVPRPIQVEALQYITDTWASPTTALQLGTGCHAAGSRVLMFDGTFKKVEDIELGDLLVGPDSKPRGVTGLHRGVDQMVEIIPVKGDPWVVNENHILALYRTTKDKNRPGGYEEITVKEYLTKNISYKHLRKLYRSSIEYPIGSCLPMDPYFLGVWLGDGTSKEPSVTTMDEKIKDYCYKIADDYGLKVSIGCPTRTSPTYHISRGLSGGGENPITKQLRELQVYGNKHIPLVYLTSSREDRLTLLAGILDTDGYLDRNTFEVVTSIPKFREGILQLARSLGFRATYSIKMVRLKGWAEARPYQRICITGDTDLIPTILEHKKATPRKQKKSPLVTGFTLRHVGRGNYYGFTVTGDHLYLMEDFTVTHNCGKSAIGVSVLKEYGGVYIVPSNVLMDQLIKDYPEINYLKGVEHYSCSRLPDNPEMGCADATVIFGTSCSTDCNYQSSIHRCLEGEPTFANPFSYMHVKNRQGFTTPKVIVVDEFHSIDNAFNLMSSISLPKKYGAPKELTVPSTLSWLKDAIIAEREVLKDKDKKDLEGVRICRRSIDKLVNVYRGLTSSPHLYTLYSEKDKVHIRPMSPPKYLIDNFFDCIKVVCMSATLNRNVVQDTLQEREFEFKSFGTPIPKENRSLRFEPSAFPMNYKTDPKLIAAWIRKKMRAHPNVNTICHLTYSDVEKLREYFPEAICITKETKTEAIREFKVKGGLLLAAACSEGVDLPNDECRLNLIPRLSKPNLMDEVIKKRKGLSDGEEWYRLQIMQTLQQQVGRSTRGVEDHSVSIIGDPNMKWIWGSVKNMVNKDFNQSIIWKDRR